MSAQRHVLHILALSLMAGLAACADKPETKSPKGLVPDDAAAVTARKKGALRFQADQVGTVYIFDVNSGRVVYTGPLKPGDDFVFDPATQVAAIGGIVIPQWLRVEPDHVHQIYFRRQGTSAEGAGGFQRQH